MSTSISVGITPSTSTNAHTETASSVARNNGLFDPNLLHVLKLTNGNCSTLGTFHLKVCNVQLRSSPGAACSDIKVTNLSSFNVDDRAPGHSRPAARSSSIHLPRREGLLYDQFPRGFPLDLSHLPRLCTVQYSITDELSKSSVLPCDNWQGRQKLIRNLSTTHL